MTAVEADRVGMRYRRTWALRDCTLAIPAGQVAALVGPLTLALARRPKLLLLDEPLASLDPLARQDVMGWLMASVAEDGLSVVFSSHIVSELERVANYLVVLSAGQVQVAAPVDDLIKTHRALTGPADAADSLEEQMDVVTMARAGRQAQALVRATDTPPGWAGRPVTMEELVLGYLKQPQARVVSGLAAVR